MRWREDWGTTLLYQGVEVGLSGVGGRWRREAGEVGCRRFAHILGCILSSSHREPLVFLISVSP